MCSAAKAEQARSLGADHVIDYAKEDFTRSGKQYDLILAVNGSRSIFDYKRALTPRGIYVMAGGNATQLFQALLLGPWLSLLGKQKLGALSSQPNQKDLLYMKELLESGEVKPVIDRRYPLSQVADAIRYVEQGHARGKVVIDVA